MNNHKWKKSKKKTFCDNFATQKSVSVCVCRNKIIMFIILVVLWTAVKSNDNVMIIFYNKPRNSVVKYSKYDSATYKQYAAATATAKGKDET